MPFATRLANISSSGAPGFTSPPREIVNFAIPIVGDEEPLVAAEPGDPLRNVAEQQLEARVQRLHVPALLQQQRLRAAQTINMVESRLQQEDGAQERQESAEADLQGPHAPGRARIASLVSETATTKG